eukprot:jgi/Chlat1/7026/Chrsp56S06698
MGAATELHVWGDEVVDPAAAEADPYVQPSSVACGWSHVAVVVRGRVLCWGANDWGQLGDGSENAATRSEPARPKHFGKAVQVAAGSHFTAAITDAGELWAWGRYQGANAPRRVPRAFHGTSPVLQVACGAHHAAAVSADGQLQTWGYNTRGQLGRGTRSDGQQVPRRVEHFVRDPYYDDMERPLITVVACGQYHTACVSAVGEVFTWGEGSQGQLGHLTLSSSDWPRRISTLVGTPLKTVSCGQAHTAGVTVEGALYMWGSNATGELGVGPPAGEALLRGIGMSTSAGALVPLQCAPLMLVPRNVTSVACGQCHTVASLSDGSLLGWGYNAYGQIAGGHADANVIWHPQRLMWPVAGSVDCLSAGGARTALLARIADLKTLCQRVLALNLTSENAHKVAQVATSCDADALYHCARALIEGKWRPSIEHALGSSQTQKQPQRWDSAGVTGLADHSAVTSMRPHCPRRP